MYEAEKRIKISYFQKTCKINSTEQIESRNQIESRIQEIRNEGLNDFGSKGGVVRTEKATQINDKQPIKIFAISKQSIISLKI